MRGVEPTSQAIVKFQLPLLEFRWCNCTISSTVMSRDDELGDFSMSSLLTFIHCNEENMEKKQNECHSPVFLYCAPMITATATLDLEF